VKDDFFILQKILPNSLKQLSKALQVFKIEILSSTIHDPN